MRSRGCNGKRCAVQKDDGRQRASIPFRAVDVRIYPKVSCARWATIELSDRSELTQDVGYETRALRKSYRCTYNDTIAQLCNHIG